MEVVKTKYEKNAIKKALAVLKDGGLVILPTETVYVASVDVGNHAAVKKLIRYKNRPFGKPFSIGVTDLEMVKHYVKLNRVARNLYQAFSAKPLTVVSCGRHQVAPGIESEAGTLGVIIPRHPVVAGVIKAFGRPITVTSANASYQKKPYKISDILDNLSLRQKALIDLIVDAGELPLNEPSTVIDTTLDDPVVLRQGEVRLKDKTKILSRSEENTWNIGKELWQKYESYHGKRAIVFALEGQLGAGKTQFTKGLALAMGVKEEVISPTYNLEIEYRGRNAILTHIDVWKVQDAK